MKIAVLFPGQGSQFIGMGKEFIETRSDCREVVEIAESVCDFPLQNLIHQGPMEELTRVEVLMPAITLTNLVCLRALESSLPPGVNIEGFAGHSLGEYSALCGAGVISVEDAIKLVERRGFFMGREGTKNPGGMRAVLGLDIETVERVVDNYHGDGVVTIANHNTGQQIVISGDVTGLDGVAGGLQEKGGKVIALNVSVANHSPLVAGAVPDFSAFMDSVTFKPPVSPVYFNVSAATENDPSAIKKMMARQIASRVRWYELISLMISDGVDTFIEVGPKSVLKGMMRKIVPKGTSVTSLQFDSPENLQVCLDKLDFG
jgi:[acyl-carrier-protein] S-malonyltransferase